MPNKNRRFDASDEFEKVDQGKPDVDASGRHETVVGSHAGENRVVQNLDDENSRSTGDALIQKNARVFRIVLKFE